MDVSDRRGHAQLTQEAKIASDFYFIRAIFAFAGFASVLGLPRTFASGAGLIKCTAATDASGKSGPATRAAGPQIFFTGKSRLPRETYLPLKPGLCRKAARSGVQKGPEGGIRWVARFRP